MNDLRTAAQQALEALEKHQEALKAWPEHTLAPHECVAMDASEKAITALRSALAQQAEPVEPVAWKQGSLVTFNEDPYPALGGLFVQLWDGEEVAARVYANNLKTLRQRCAKVNTAPPQRLPLTEEEMYIVEEEARKNFRLAQAGPRGQMITYWDSLTPWLIRAVERAHGIKE